MLKNLFPIRKPIIGVLHLAGENPVKRALEEAEILSSEGIDGILVENYHGTVQDVTLTLEALARRGFDFQVGINILPNDSQQAFLLASLYNLPFIQLDHVAGEYVEGKIDASSYFYYKTHSSGIKVFGGVHPKYYTPLHGSDLEHDIRVGKQRADALVVTGVGTGHITPLSKIQTFRRIVGNEYPLFVGAGMTPEYVHSQLQLTDGAIVGSYFKAGGVTINPVEKERVREFMDVVRDVRRGL